MSRMEKRLRGDFTALFNFLRKARLGSAVLCCLATNDRTCRNGTKMYYARFRLDIRKKFWNRSLEQAF